MANNDQWHEYGSFEELKGDLGLTDEEMAVADKATASYVQAWELAEVRKAQGRSQRRLASTMGVSQPRVSAIENGDLEKVSVSILRAYAEALGGKLRVSVEFDGKQYPIG